MNRVIKFRGLTDTQAPTWVYGSLVNNLWNYSEHSKYPKGSAVCEILVSGESDCWEDIDAYEQAVIVIPESVGQFTGLKDKNGKEIYEWDIIEGNPVYGDYKIRAVVFFDEKRGMWMVREITDYTHPDIEYLFEIIKDNRHGAEVIGNLYETPHLLPNNLNKEI